MRVCFDALNNKAYVKPNGHWVECELQQVVGRPEDDVTPENTALELAQANFNKAKSALADFISYMKQDIKEKQELADLSVESAQSVTNKKSYYKPLYEEFKTDYEAKKAALTALQ